MKLKSFGCSLVFGTDLHDDGRYSHYATGSLFTYPALIAKHFGWQYVNCARPGAGNLEILARILNDIAISEPALYMVNWSFVDRFSYIREDMVTRNRYNKMGWTSIMPVDETEIAKCYHRHIHSQLRDKFESLNTIKSAVDALRSENYKFVMTWTDSLLWETDWHCPPAVQWLQNQVRDNCTDFAGQSFLDFSRIRGHEISRTMHPLESAHEDAADYLLSRWDSVVR